jgi:hypothetical protein
MRYAPFFRSAVCVVAGIAVVLSTAAVRGIDIYTELPPDLAAYDSSKGIHIQSAKDADAVRKRVIEYMWGGSGLPAEMSTSESVYSRGGELPADLVGLNKIHLESADRLTANLDYRYRATMYLLHPADMRNAKRLAIVSHGHADYVNRFNAGVGTLIDHLLKNGFTVLSMEMPLFGWNTNGFYDAPGHEGWWTPPNHDSLVNALEGSHGKSALRFFIEPVVHGINHFAGTCADYTDISMIGLSGGGWTTVLAAAVDSRIKTSVSVSGSMPIYARRYYPGSMGDAEQLLPALYRDRASYLDLYTLDSCGNSRRHVQCINQYDNGCFYGVSHRTWEKNVKDAVTSIGAGTYECYLDSLPHSHQISNNAIHNVIDPALAIAALIPPPPSIDEQFDAAGTPPPGWFYGPSNQGDAVVTSGAGIAEFRGGSGVAAIFNSATLDPRRHTKAEVKIENIGEGNVVGMFLTDNPNQRDHVFGVQIDSSGSLYLASDHGGAFRTRLLKNLDGYGGGPVTLTLSWDSAGCTVSTNTGSFSTGRIAFPLADHFSLADLGPDVCFFVQKSTSGGATASLNSVTVQTIAERH